MLKTKFIKDLQSLEREVNWAQYNYILKEDQNDLYWRLYAISDLAKDIMMQIKGFTE